MPVVELPADAKIEPIPSTGRVVEIPRDAPLDQPPSFASGFGAGLVDKALGALQFGAHATVDAPPIAYTESQQQAAQVQPEAARALDTRIGEREKVLDVEGYNRGWGRTVGNVAGD